MNLIKVFSFLGAASLLQDKTVGEEQGNFLEKYRNEIQEYTMAGHEKGWKHCDILSADPFSNKDLPRISVDLDKIQTLNVRSNFAFSNCLIVSYDVSSLVSLEKLIDFGRAAIEHKRLALVVKMKSGLTLDMITNTTKLPFMIAAELSKGKEQFLCPVVGALRPILEENICNPSYASYKGKRLRVTFMGNAPYFIPINDGLIDGTDIKMIRILEKKLNFRSEIIVAQSHLDAMIKVCNHFISKKAYDNSNPLFYH